jgi:hypothetical protein
MYFIPLVLLVLLSIGILFGPILALILLFVFLLGLGVYKFFGPGTEPEHAPLSEVPAGGAPVTSKREATEHGMWGEKRPGEQDEETP